MHYSGENRTWSPYGPLVRGAVREILCAIGEDPDRDGLARTPERVARSLAWLTRGYGADVRDVIGDALFEEAHEIEVFFWDIVPGELVVRLAELTVPYGKISRRIKRGIG